MNALRCQVTAGLLASLVLTAPAVTHYVDVNNANPMPPYTNWATAAIVIQDAVDIAMDGDEIVVTNGVYQTGATAVYGMSNRVALTKSVMVQSVNGPESTYIAGSGPTGPAAVRCVYLTSGAMLSGFTLTNGATQASGNSDTNVSGGGVWCESLSAVVSNCVLTGNSANDYGGGAYSGTLNNCSLSNNSAGHGGGGSYSTLNNCTLTANSGVYGGGTYWGTLNKCMLSGNSAFRGGGAYGGTLNNCTLTNNSASGLYSSGGGAYRGTLNNCLLTGNSADSSGGGFCGESSDGTLNNCTLARNRASRYGGGAYAGTLRNCIVYHNSAGQSGDNYYNFYGGTLNYCCTTPLPSTGEGNISAEPQLASASHLSAVSPCRGAGRAYTATGLDLDGEPWANPPSMGCDEYWSGSVTGALSVALVAAYTNVAAVFTVDFQAMIGGRVSASRWDFGDGTVLSNRPWASHAWAAAGDYVVELRAYNERYPTGVAANVTVHVLPQPIQYVALNSSGPLAPYHSWATAATNIQDAVDAATLPGALVLVSNGVYQTGARAVNGSSNRVAVTQPLRVQSVNGPGVTTIAGYLVDATNGGAAVRCVYLAGGAVLSGFTLTSGTSLTAGGGVSCESPSAVVSNCVLRGNSSFAYGGGAYSGTLNNCTLSSNSASAGGGCCFSALYNCSLTDNLASAQYGGYGGGAFSGTLNNCTLSGNLATYTGGGAYAAALRDCALSSNSSAQFGGGASFGVLDNCALDGNSAVSGGGAYSNTLNNCTLINNSASRSGGGTYAGTLNNCIVYYNSAAWSGDNYDSSTLNYCCTTPRPSTGAGNLSAEPQLASSSHLSAGSPCIGRGSAAYATGVDIDGEPWAAPPSIGCDEYRSGLVTGAVSVAIVAAYTNVSAGFGVDFQAVIGGRVSASRWDFGDGVLISNRPSASHAWSTAGDYVVELRAYNESSASGVAASVMVRVVAPPVHCVALSSRQPEPPYANWATAATNIQDAVDAAAVPGALVLVSNGVYAVGATAVYGMSNRVALTKPLTVQSINGPGVTAIVGYQIPGTTNGAAAVRCVYLTNGAVLSGFTLTNGATQKSGGYDQNQSGGGVWCESSRAVVSNCVLSGNSANEYGGGAYRGTLYNCTLTGNSVKRTYYGYGGGAYSSTLNNCNLSGNSAYQSGGGAYSGTLNNCTLSANSADLGGGVSAGTLNNCTLTGNTARYGGGAGFCTLNNCIVYYNRAAWGGDNYDSGTLNYCCTTPLPEGTGNISSDPLFVDTNGWRNLRLQINSPCINAGNNACISDSTDLDGRPRVVGGRVDIGAYEYQGLGMSEFIGWLWQNGLPLDGLADFVDTDLDGHNNWQEWRADTVPTNALSRLAMLEPTNAPIGVEVSWQSVPTRSYFLERGTNVASVPALLTLATNLAGQSGTTTFTDTTATNGGPFFYRVGVQP